MNIKFRQAVERHLVRQFIRDAIRLGFTLSVDDGEDGYFIERSSDPKAVLKACLQMDEDRIYVYPKGSTDRVGWVYFVYGNEGFDVLSDYTLGIVEELLASTRALADKLENGEHLDDAFK
jgi:hypothetical protein